MPIFSNAQEFRGGEITLVHQGINRYHVLIDIYFQADDTIDKPFLPMDYSYGTKDTALLMNHQFLPNNIQLLSYLDSFIMPATGSLYKVTVLDTFSLPALKNLEGNNKDFFVMQTELFIASWVPDDHILPVFNSLQTDIDNTDGIITHDLMMEDTDGDILTYGIFAFADVEGYDYTLPAADNEIFINEDGVFIWDSPIEEGKYLIQLVIAEYFSATGWLLSTTKRTMIFDTEDVFITNISNVTNEMNINIFPNPTTSKIHLNLEGIPISTTLVSTIIDVYGKTVAEYNFNSSDTQTINVEHLPSGIYFLKIETENQIFSKKFVKQ